MQDCRVKIDLLGAIQFLPEETLYKELEFWAFLHDRTLGMELFRPRPRIFSQVYVFPVRNWESYVRERQNSIDIVK